MSERSTKIENIPTANPELFLQTHLGYNENRKYYFVSCCPMEPNPPFETLLIMQSKYLTLETVNRFSAKRFQELVSGIKQDPRYQELVANFNAQGAHEN